MRPHLIVLLLISGCAGSPAIWHSLSSEERAKADAEEQAQRKEDARRRPSLVEQGKQAQAKYDAMLEGWTGRSEDELIRQWGPPSSVYKTASKTFLFYSESVTDYSGATAWCETTFELTNTKVTFSRWKGNFLGLLQACRSRY